MINLASLNQLLLHKKHQSYHRNNYYTVPKYLISDKKFMQFI